MAALSLAAAAAAAVIRLIVGWMIGASLLRSTWSSRTGCHLGRVSQSIVGLASDSGVVVRDSIGDLGPQLSIITFVCSFVREQAGKLTRWAHEDGIERTRFKLRAPPNASTNRCRVA